MKPINEARLAKTLQYIQEEYHARGECPTYRAIMEGCGYSSLSLVHADVARLKERGFLLEGEKRRLHLASEKEEKALRYDYPFLILTDALENLDRLGEEEKTLLLAQDAYLKGDYETSQAMSQSLLSSTKDKSVRFGAELTLCWCAMYTGDVERWKSFYRTLLSYRVQSISEKQEKELIAHFLTNVLGSDENLPPWLSEGRFYDLRKEAHPLADLLFVANAFRKDPSLSPYYFEPLCSEAWASRNDLCQVYMDLSLALSYHYAKEDQYRKEHLQGALRTCLKRGWITPLIEMRRALGSLLDDAVSLWDEPLLKKMGVLEEKLNHGFAKLYDVLIEKSPTRNLTFREIEVINYVRLNYQTKEIASRLYLSPDTVKHHLGSIYSKLGVKNRAELRELIRRGG